MCRFSYGQIVALRRTFVVGDNSGRNLHLPARWDVARGGFQEEERLLGRGVVQLLDVLCVIAPDGYNLLTRSARKNKTKSVAFFSALPSESRHNFRKAEKANGFGCPERASGSWEYWSQT
jgi:hypothetical protein